MGLGPLDKNRLAQESTDELEVVFLDHDLGRMVVEVSESMVGLDLSSKTQRRTLELVVIIGNSTHDDTSGSSVDYKLH